MRGGHVGGHAVLGGDVGAQEACGLAEFLRRGLALVLIDVEQRDLAAMRHEGPRHRVAETGGAAGDDGLDLIELHGKSLGDIEKPPW
ncbi:hypothetical protein RLIN73S_03407 [Rhodanobacter lindaniclasticus]